MVKNIQFDHNGTYRIGEGRRNENLTEAEN